MIAMIPAGGVVEFSVAWDADFEATGYIDGGDVWARPVVGLVHDPDVHDADPRSLPYSPVIVSEWSLLYTADDYIDMCGFSPFDCMAVYRPEVDGPIGEAPRRRILIPLPAEG
jgi:hypothetical protein